MREMKDSGVEWIGKIPASWNYHPLYYYFDERKNRNFDLRERNLLSLSYGNIIKKDINTTGGLLPASFNTYNIVKNLDIIIRPTDLQNDKKSLRTGLVKEKIGIITSAYIALKPREGVFSNYFHYLLHSYDIMKVFYNMGNGVRQGLNYSEFSKLILVAPSLEEQHKIADFLDQKCSEIDALTADIQTQIETLEEYKKSVIIEAVTKGLDPNIEMKDSGVEWIGMIPSTWKNKTLRHLLIDRVGGAWGNEPANENEGTVCLRIADFDFDKGLFKECALDELTYRTYTRKQIKKLALREGDILIEKSGGGEKTPVGRAVYYDGSYGAVLYANFMERLRFKSDEINSKFVEYWLRTWYFCRCSPFYINQTIGIQNIDLTLMLAKEQIFFPLLQDQYKIADFLDQKCAEIDQTISEKQQQLETVAEYKKSLIYEYVTGKKEVA